MVDVPKEWIESMRCIDNVKFDFHTEGAIKSRPAISSREQLRAMYPECLQE